MRWPPFRNWEFALLSCGVVIMPPPISPSLPGPAPLSAPDVDTCFCGSMVRFAMGLTVSLLHGRMRHSECMLMINYGPIFLVVPIQAGIPLEEYTAWTQNGSAYRTVATFTTFWPAFHRFSLLSLSPCLNGARFLRPNAVRLSGRFTVQYSHSSVTCPVLSFCTPIFHLGVVDDFTRTSWKCVHIYAVHIYAVLCLAPRLDIVCASTSMPRHGLPHPCSASLRCHANMTGGAELPVNSRSKQPACMP